MKKLSYLIALALILGLILTGCSLLSNISQVPATEQSGINYLTKNGIDPYLGLVGLWRFDEGSGTAADDSSGNNNHGILTNMNTDTCWVSSNYGTALLFDGANDYVEVDDSESLRITDELTIEAWVKQGLGGSNLKIVSRRDSFYFYFLGVNYGKPYGGIGNGSTYTVTTQTDTMPSNEWHHLAFVYDELTGTMCLYYDGAPQETVTVTQSLPAQTGVKLSIGADDQGTIRFFEGLIDEVRVWSSVLGDTQLDDMLPPEVTLHNDGQTYFLNEIVYASWTANDAGTGVASEEGSVFKGSELNTSTVDTYSFTVTATDYAMNTVTETVTYYVHDPFSDFLPPVKADRAFKLGSTIPVKFQLRDAQGNFITDAEATILLEKLNGGEPGGDVFDDSSGAANIGNEFRYDLTSNQYIFNLSTKGATIGEWRIIITMDYGATYFVDIGLK